MLFDARCLLFVEQAIASSRPVAHRCKVMTMIVVDILVAALVITMLGVMLNEDTSDRRIRIAR